MSIGRFSRVIHISIRYRWSYLGTESPVCRIPFLLRRKRRQTQTNVNTTFKSSWSDKNVNRGAYQMNSLQWEQNVGCLKKRAMNLWPLTSCTYLCRRAPRRLAYCRMLIEFAAESCADVLVELLLLLLSSSSSDMVDMPSTAVAIVESSHTSVAAVLISAQFDRYPFLFVARRLLAQHNTTNVISLSLSLSLSVLSPRSWQVCCVCSCVCVCVWRFEWLCVYLFICLYKIGNAIEMIRLSNNNNNNNKQTAKMLFQVIFNKYMCVVKVVVWSLACVVWLSSFWFASPFLHTNSNRSRTRTARIVHDY